MQTENQKECAEVAEATSVRLALCVEYVGERYKGWQKQQFDQLPTVQEEVERALQKIACHPVSVICAGRTDTGVNGTYQIIHFDTVSQRPERAWVLGVNSHLPQDIAVRWAREVDVSFHARFSALRRRYRYLIYSSPVKPAILSKGVTWTHKPLDLEKMQRGAAQLKGEHDFTSYRAVACQAKSPVRTIHSIDVYPCGELLVLDVCANAFLHHMIRNIAGVLMTVGSGEASVEWVSEVLEARDRRKGGITAPPHGLYFVDVKYPDVYDLPPSALGPYFLAQP